MKVNIPYDIESICNAIVLSAFSPLFTKEGLGVILRNNIKIPLYPPFQRGGLSYDIA
jgi:hypothetical protein